MGICNDLVPVDEKGYAIRPYGINDAFKGNIGSRDTLWMGRPVYRWLEDRGLTSDVLGKEGIDLQQASLFPCLESTEKMEQVLQWMIGTERFSSEGKDIWLRSARFSADVLMDRASLSQLYAQRKELRRRNYGMLERNYEKSVFYQLDLADVYLCNSS